MMRPNAAPTALYSTFEKISVHRVVDERRRGAKAAWRSIRTDAQSQRSIAKPLLPRRQQPADQRRQIGQSILAKEPARIAPRQGIL
jgi:hypothetical protein